jgi:large subunit ribosomal protein L15
VGALDAAIEAGKLDGSQPITEAILYAAGLATNNKDGIRLLGEGKITRAITITVCGASATAKAAVEQAGGSVTTTVAPKAAPAEAA